MDSYSFLNILILFVPWTSPVDSAVVEVIEPFRLQTYTTSIPSPRTLILDPAGDILVLSSSSRQVLKLVEVPNPSNPTSSVILHQHLIVNGSRWNLNLNHGLAVFDSFLYASTESQVFRWPYTPGNHEEVIANPQVIVNDLPSPGQHRTRTIVLNEEYLFVSIGSGSDIDEDSSRARVVRFHKEEASIPSGGFNYSQHAELFADGVRNEVGLAFDPYGVMWGVGNQLNTGMDRPDLGTNLTNGNPAEEMHRFDRPGEFHGYPYCFNSFRLEGYPAGTQFALPTFLDNEGNFNDDWCRNSSNVKPPALVFPDHSAPLGISFFKGNEEGPFEIPCGNDFGAFPCSLQGDAFVALHGANPTYTDPPTGYSVNWVPFEKSTNNNYSNPTGTLVEIMKERSPKTCRSSSEKCFRPVNAIFDKHGFLIVSSDHSGEIFRLSWNVPPPEVIITRK